MRAEEERAYTEYVQGRVISLRRTAYRLCGDWQLAEDLTQSALIKLFIAWRRAREARSVDAYSQQILVRQWLDETRRPWRRTTSVPDLPDAAARNDDPTNRLVLITALAHVPPRQRAAVVLRFWEGLSVAETAEAMKCSQGTVKSQTSAGLAALRRLLPGAGFAAGTTPQPARTVPATAFPGAGR
jgi:RNA polymerase sigma-70 factor (sigma-E family)